MNRPIDKQQGLSLIELMIAIVISSLLMAGTIQIFVNNKQTYRVQEALSRLQENGRFAMQFLTRDIRMADFWGCAGSASKVTNRVQSADGGITVPPIDMGTGGVNGTDNTGLNGSDSITLQGAYGSGLSIASHNVNAASFSLNTVNHGLVDGDLVLATDCNKADQFMITNANSGSTVTIVGNTGVAHNNLENSGKPALQYPEGDILKVFNYGYTIKAGASGEPALFRRINSTDQELVEGIENMQIKYGEDTDSDGTANIYRDSGAVANMENVVSIRITLTARTLEDNVSLSGGRITRAFSSTITIRNRVS